MSGFNYVPCRFVGGPKDGELDLVREGAVEIGFPILKPPETAPQHGSAEKPVATVTALYTIRTIHIADGEPIHYAAPQGMPDEDALRHVFFNWRVRTPEDSA